MAVRTCPFCSSVLSRQRKLLYKSETLWVFRSRFPIAREHLIIASAKHVEHAEGIESKELLEMVRHVGNVVLESERLVIHLPPFNSVEHFHVHALRGPFVNTYRDWTHSGMYPFSRRID